MKTIQPVVKPATPPSPVTTSPTSAAIDHAKIVREWWEEVLRTAPALHHMGLKEYAESQWGKLEEALRAH